MDSLSVEVFDSLHELLAIFRERMRKAMEAVLPELTFYEMRIIVRTGRQPGITQKDLVARSHTDKAQLARTLSHLQEQGWLLRSASQSDKRVRCLDLSAQGQELFAQLRKVQNEVATQLLKNCEASKQKELLVLLELAADSARASP